MNPQEIFSNFLLYAFITAYTPGPNNLISFGNASTFGFKKTIPLLMGLLVSFLILMTLSGLATSSFSAFLPDVMPLLTLVGAIYILWLAYKLALSEPPKDVDMDKSITFWQAFFLNCLNVKVLVYGLTSFTTFVLPVSSSDSTIIAAAIFLSVMGSSANFVWALAGNALKELLQKHNKAVNITLALLLVYSVATMFF